MRQAEFHRAVDQLRAILEEPADALGFDELKLAEWLARAMCTSLRVKFGARRSWARERANTLPDDVPPIRGSGWEDFNWNDYSRQFGGARAYFERRKGGISWAIDGSSTDKCIKTASGWWSMRLAKRKVGEIETTGRLSDQGRSVFKLPMPRARKLAEYLRDVIQME